MIAIIWRYEVKEAHRAQFESAYGPKGVWAQLFARSGGYRGSELLRAQDGSYLTLDVWRARADFDAFIAEHREAYDTLDSQTENWTLAEHRLGEYRVID